MKQLNLILLSCLGCFSSITFSPLGVEDVLRELELDQLELGELSLQLNPSPEIKPDPRPYNRNPNNSQVLADYVANLANRQTFRYSEDTSSLFSREGSEQMYEVIPPLSTEDLELLREHRQRNLQEYESDRINGALCCDGYISFSLGFLGIGLCLTGDPFLIALGAISLCGSAVHGYIFVSALIKKCHLTNNPVQLTGLATELGPLSI